VKRCIYVTLGGALTVEEMRTGTDKIVAEGRAMGPGWRLITDITNMKTGTPEVAAEITAGQAKFVAAGCAFGVRITGDSAVAGMQLKRTAKDAGYHSVNVHTLADAEIELAKNS
jgi:hypothetical protein